MDGFDSNTALYSPCNAIWLAKASQLAYSDDATIQSTLNSVTWGLNIFRGFHNDVTDTHGFVASNNDMILVAFRGTEQNIKDWLTDLDAIKIAGPKGIGMVHKGFYEALLGIWDQLIPAITVQQNKGQKIWVTGHSLGGALALLAVAKMVVETHIPSLSGVYTYGKPRVGNQDFASYIDSKIKSINFRFVNDDDVVPHVPPDIFDFKHERTILYFDGYGNIKTSESFWTMIKNQIGGEVNGIWKDRSLVPVIIYDHLIAHYIEKLIQNKNNNPFWGIHLSDVTPIYSTQSSN